MPANHRDTVFFDVDDTLAYLWVPKAERLRFLVEQSEVLSDPGALDWKAGQRAFERAWERPLPDGEPSYGWRGSAAHYQAALEAAGVTTSTALLAQALMRRVAERPSHIFLDPDAVPVLERLHAAHYRLGIISNWPEGLEDVLDTLRIRHYFSVVAASGSLGWKKPSPEIFRWALEQLHVTGERCVYVGDEPTNDVWGCSQLGMRPILLDTLGAYGEGYRDLSYTLLHALRDLPELLGPTLVV